MPSRGVHQHLPITVHLLFVVSVTLESTPSTSCCPSWDTKAKQADLWVQHCLDQAWQVCSHTVHRI